MAVQELLHALGLINEVQSNDDEFGIVFHVNDGDVVDVLNDESTDRHNQPRKAKEVN